MNYSSVAKRSLRVLSRGILGLSALILFIVEDVFWAAMKPAMAALARLPFVERVEAWIETLSPNWLLVLFIVPMAIVWPIKLIGLAIIATGRVVLGTIIFTLAEIVGAALAVRLWSIGRDRLLTIRWFAAVYYWLSAIRARVYAYALDLPGVAFARQAISDLRERLGQVLANIRRQAS
jgi:hypothetical protein